MSASLLLSSSPSRVNVNLSSPRSVSRSTHVNIPWRAVEICHLQARIRPLIVVRAEQQTGAQNPEEDENKVTNNMSLGLPNLSLSSIPSLATWILGSALFLVPLYRRFIFIEDKLEKTTTAVLDMVEKVAETADEMAEDLGKTLPENSKLKKVALAVERIAEEVDKDAEILESVVKKVDDVVDELDRMVEPIIEGKIPLDGSKKTRTTGTDPTMQ